MTIDGAAAEDGRKRRRRRRRPLADGPCRDTIEAVEPEFDDAPIDDLLRQAARGAIDISEL